MFGTAKNFNLNGATVSTGDWVTHLCPTIHQPVFTRVCDKQVARDGLTVWYYSPTYGEACAEAGFMQPKHFGPIRKCTQEEINALPSAMVAKSDKFLKMCYEYDFQ